MPFTYKEQNPDEPIELGAEQPVKQEIPTTPIEQEQPTPEAEKPTRTRYGYLGGPLPPEKPDISQAGKVAQTVPQLPQLLQTATPISAFKGDLMTYDQYEAEKTNILSQEPPQRTLKPIPLWLNIFMLAKDASLGKMDWLQFIMNERPQMANKIRMKNEEDAKEWEVQKPVKLDRLYRKYQSDQYQLSGRERALMSAKRSLAEQARTVSLALQQAQIDETSAKEQKAVRVFDPQSGTYVHRALNPREQGQYITMVAEKIAGLREKLNDINQQLLSYKSQNATKDMSGVNLGGGEEITPDTPDTGIGIADEIEQLAD